MWMKEMKNVYKTNLWYSSAIVRYLDNPFMSQFSHLPTVKWYPELSIVSNNILTQLSGNQISELRRDDLRSLAISLKTLDLSGNSLASVPEGIFWDLQVCRIFLILKEN